MHRVFARSRHLIIVEEITMGWILHIVFWAFRRLGPFSQDGLLITLRSQNRVGCSLAMSLGLAHIPSFLCCPTILLGGQALQPASGQGPHFLWVSKCQTLCSIPKFLLLQQSCSKPVGSCSLAFPIYVFSTSSWKFSGEKYYIFCLKWDFMYYLKVPVIQALPCENGHLFLDITVLGALLNIKMVYFDV